MIVDAGLLIAIDRDEPEAKDFVEAARLEGESLRSTAPVAAQAWRDGSRQVRLARFLTAIDVRPFTSADFRQVGELLRHSGTADVVDAHVLACAVKFGEHIVTSDLSDYMRLAAHLGSDAPGVHDWR